MPEEKQKIWTKLVKRQSRTTWAVLGVALVALLLAVWWLPAIASVPQISSFSPDDDDELAEQSGNPGFIKIRADSTTVNIHEEFLIKAYCNKNYQVKAIYATLTDAEGVLSVDYNNVYAMEQDDDGEDPTIYWAIAFVFGGFSADSGDGHELLSMLQVEKTVGLEEDMVFVIAGDVTSSMNEQNDELTVKVVFESKGHCFVDIQTEDQVPD